MELAQQTPGDRRSGRVALKLGVFTILIVALFANAYFGGNGLISFIIVLAAVLLGCFFTSRMYLKIVLAALASVMSLFLPIVLASWTQVYVSLSAPSPDGRVVAEVQEVPAFAERHFVVRLTTNDRGETTHYKDVFRSPDEGPPESECLLWSTDGRYLLLLGTGFGAMRQEAYLPSGEWLYLFVDTEKDVVYYNSRQVRPERPFTVDDLKGIDFGVSITGDAATNAREICTQEKIRATNSRGERSRGQRLVIRILGILL
ncbi:MAG: hypothetical protein ACE5IQ_03000 [Candidatus Methylomirabilales bacterium]